MKGLPEDACGELAVYQNLRGSTERLVHKDLTYITGVLIPYKLDDSLQSLIILKSRLKSKCHFISIRALSFYNSQPVEIRLYYILNNYFGLFNPLNKIIHHDLFYYTIGLVNMKSQTQAGRDTSLLLS